MYCQLNIYILFKIKLIPNSFRDKYISGAQDFVQAAVIQFNEMAERFKQVS